MLTKDDFLAIAEAQIAADNTQFALLYRAGDPRVVEPIAANAHMLALLSQQIDVASNEVFEKVRDSTVLADAALKGILPKAISPRISIKVTNSGDHSFTLEQGRTLLDQDGNVCIVEKPVTVEGGNSIGFAEAVIETKRVISHTVSEYKAFYSIEIPKSDEGLFLSAIHVENAFSTDFNYHPSFMNVGVGEKVYHVESDEYQRMFVVFGYEPRVGYQPLQGEVFNIILFETPGDVRPDLDSSLSFEYTTVTDLPIKLQMNSLLRVGTEPPSLSVTRELTRFPALYDDDAVYLGEWQRLVKKKIPSLRFISVWNEQIEESVRGPDWHNINKLFVAFVPPLGGNVTELQAEIKEIIRLADDGFKVNFIDVVNKNPQITITAEIARVHDAEAVKQQIKAALLKQYGQDSDVSKFGLLRLQTKAVGKHLEEVVPALKDDGSDYEVKITNIDHQKPEDWVFVSSSSISITITPSNSKNGQWGH